VFFGEPVSAPFTTPQDLFLNVRVFVFAVDFPVAGFPVRPDFPSESSFSTGPFLEFSSPSRLRRLAFCHPRLRFLFLRDFSLPARASAAGCGRSDSPAVGSSSQSYSHFTCRVFRLAARETRCHRTSQISCFGLRFVCRSIFIYFAHIFFIVAGFRRISGPPSFPAH
jgi:hypothetical protein